MELFFILEFMKSGKFLIATPSIMSDTNFHRAVILLVDHKTSGTIGFIINKKLEYTLNDVMDGINFEIPLYFGGPVEDDNLFFIHRASHLIPNSICIEKDLYWSGDFKTVITQINNGTLTKNEIRFFLGYSGWTKAQLKDEISLKSWRVVDDITNNTWLKKNAINLWKEHMKAIGGNYLIWSNAPKNPNWN